MSALLLPRLMLPRVSLFALMPLFASRADFLYCFYYHAIFRHALHFYRYAMLHHII